MATGRLKTSSDQLFVRSDGAVTPLSMSKEHGSGVAWGSGAYIQGAQYVWVLTPCLPNWGCIQ